MLEFSARCQISGKSIANYWICWIECLIFCIKYCAQFLAFLRTLQNVGNWMNFCDFPVRNLRNCKVNGRFAQTLRQKCLQSRRFFVWAKETQRYIMPVRVSSLKRTQTLFCFWGSTEKQKIVEMLTKRKDLDANIENKWHSKSFFVLIKKIWKLRIFSE